MSTETQGGLLSDEVRGYIGAHHSPMNFGFKRDRITLLESALSPTTRGESISSSLGRECPWRCSGVLSASTDRTYPAQS